jgi:8-oxo-dGTP pyrophosphatase MutT (NUDIX family)
MLGQSVRAKVVIPLGAKDENGVSYPRNYGKIYNAKEQYALILGVDHAVSNFDGRIIALIKPIYDSDKDKHWIWVLAPKSSRYVDCDIREEVGFDENFQGYELHCLYETSCGSVVYSNIKGSIRYLLVKNKRSANWGFPKGHIEQGETKYDCARREVFEETGLRIKIHLGYEGLSKYKLKGKVDKRVFIYVSTTPNIATTIQEKEIDDYAWLTYPQAMQRLTFKNDRVILRDAREFLIANKFIENK